MIKDRLTLRDEVNTSKRHQKTFRTKILYGKDPYIDPRNGVTYLGEVWDEEENETTIGGAVYIFEKLFNDRSPFNIPTLESQLGINTGYEINPIDAVPKEHCVCLFTVGIGGAGDSSLSTYAPDFKVSKLNNIIPFRFTDTALTGAEAEKYFMRKTIPATENDPERYAYYAKELDSHSIKVLWDDAEGEDEGSEVTASDLDSDSPLDMVPFEEIVLKLTKDDITEYFNYIGQSDISRINELGLYTGIKKVVNGRPEYHSVRLFAKSHINNEMLRYSNGLTIIYRIYSN